MVKEYFGGSSVAELIWTLQGRRLKPAKGSGDW